MNNKIEKRAAFCMNAQNYFINNNNYKTKMGLHNKMKKMGEENLYVTIFMYVLNRQRHFSYTVCTKIDSLLQSLS